MLRLIAKILLKITGWTVIPGFPGVDRSVVVAAPHTSAVDAFYCKLAFLIWDVPHVFLIKKDQFRFPKYILMRILHAIPVGVEGQNVIHETVGILNGNPRMHIIICPEGTRQANARWNPGFYMIAKRAGVPITSFKIDYLNKRMSMTGILPDDSIRNCLRAIAETHVDAHPRHSSQFIPPEY